MILNYLRNNAFYISLIVISFILFIGTTFFVFMITKRKSPRYSFDAKLVRFTMGLSASMLSLQFLAELVHESASSVPETFMLSLYHTIKAFGADDDFILSIPWVVEHIETALSPLLSDTKLSIVRFILCKIPFCYTCYASFLSFVAPVTSATILFEVFAKFFPKAKLFFLKHSKQHCKYYFSELNERSLALAKSILDPQKRTLTKPVIIFTDVYTNKGQEKSTELLSEANHIGALCLKEDITHIQKEGKGERLFFLIDDNEIANLQTLTNLTNKINYKSLKDSEIFLFCQDYIYTDVEKQVRKKLENEYNYTADDVTIVPVRCYRNLITNMLENTPLYEPIVHKRATDKTAILDLNITILGIGDIGTEMFLTTYWIGQMLDCKLNINVISRESKEEFWGKIDYINPEIRHTTYENDELLRIYKNKEEFSDPYCKVKYYSCDIQSDEFRKLLEGEDGRKSILDTHYFLVSLGSDHANLSIANTLKNRIGKYHIENSAQKDKTIINYVVYNADLSETLNNNQFICSYNDEPDIYMQAVGGVEQVYHAENIFMSNYKKAGEAAARDYASKQGKTDRAKAYKNRLKKGEYEYWSNLALRLHFKYKVFSTNLINHSLFDEENEYSRDMKSACDTYKNLARRQLDEKHTREQEVEFQHNMQWLEHRRWCAFLRTMGYRQTKNYESYLQATQSHKQMDMKLHPCLVECDNKGVHGTLDAQGRVADSLITKNNDGNITKINATDEDALNFDLLDQLTYELAKLKQKDSENGSQQLTKFDPCDFKQYDYPNNDYLDEV